jgi:hypothetical protein
LTDNIYVFDTSSFIELKGLIKYTDILVSFQSKLEEFISTNRLIAPKKVYDDLMRYLGSNGFKRWVKDHEKLFEDENDLNFLIALQRVTNKYPNWVDLDSARNKSDTYVVALAICKIREYQGKLVQREIIVVTEESADPKRLKIPSVCNDYKIHCVNLHDCFQLEGWKV